MGSCFFPPLSSFSFVNPLAQYVINQKRDNLITVNRLETVFLIFIFINSKPKKKKGFKAHASANGADGCREGHSGDATDHKNPDGN